MNLDIPFTQNIPQELAVLIPLIGIVVIIVLIVVVVNEISTHIMHRRRMKTLKELAEKNPDLAKAFIEERPLVVQKKTLPFAKRAKVTVFYKDGSTLEDICKITRGTLKCDKIGMQFVIPEDYSPTLAQVGKKLYPHYIFDQKGVALKITLNERDGELETLIDEYVPDPRITESVIGQQALHQIFRQLGGINFGSVIAGVGVGLLITYIVIFILLPIMGIPVTIGRTPVEVTINATSPWTGQLPPPGNYTIP